MDTRNIATMALIGAVGYGVYYFMQKQKPGIQSNYRITRYDNLTKGTSAPLGQTLETSDGDTIRVYLEFDYFGPALSSFHYVAMWEGVNHNEISGAKQTKTYFVPASDTKIIFKDTVDITLNGGILPFKQGLYGLYAKTEALPGRTVYTPFYANTIRVVGSTSFDYRNIQLSQLLPNPVSNGVSAEFTWSYEHIGAPGEYYAYTAIIDDPIPPISEIQGFTTGWVLINHPFYDAVWTSYDIKMYIPITSALPVGVYSFYCKFRRGLVEMFSPYYSGLVKQ